MHRTILTAFGLNPDDFFVKPFGSGLINHTWKVSGEDHQYILQRINKNVFKNPQAIADNLVQLANYFKNTAPAYLFTAPLATTTGEHLVEHDGDCYRLSPFIKNSHTVDFITQSNQAYEAAKQFGKFTRLLKDFDPEKLNYTLTDFHNLSLRVQQFRLALATADKERLAKATSEIKQIEDNMAVALIYEQLVNEKQIPLRVIHHDTKINNVLFDDNDKGLCVIDLDTVMPGYYMSDVGDMMRTYLSYANEEEQDLSKIRINGNNFEAVYKGYMEEMGAVLTPVEKNLFLYAGKFMIYMQAIRFLTDYLNDDIYYHTQYPDHNLMRAKNQLTLLGQYLKCEEEFKQFITQQEIGTVASI